MGFLGKKDVGNDKVYMKKIKKYVYDRTGNKSTATTLKGARKEADAAGKLAPTEGWKGYDQDTRIEVPIKKTLSERLGGKAGKEKRRLKKKRGEVPSTTKTVKVKNAKHAAKLHKKREEAGMTKTTARKAADDDTINALFKKGDEEFAKESNKKHTKKGDDKKDDKSTAKAISGSKGKPDVEPKEGHVWRKIKNKWREVRTGKKKIKPDENNKTSSSSGHPYDVTM
jgi:hypothetical protein